MKEKLAVTLVAVSALVMGYVCADLIDLINILSSRNPTIVYRSHNVASQAYVAAFATDTEMLKTKNPTGTELYTVKKSSVFNRTFLTVVRVQEL